MEQAEPPLPKAETLARAARATGAPMHELLRVAGYDEAAAVAETMLGDNGGPKVPAELTRLLGDMAFELRELRIEMSRLGVAYSLLAGEDPSQPDDEGGSTAAATLGAAPPAPERPR